MSGKIYVLSDRGVAALNRGLRRQDGSARPNGFLGKRHRNAGTGSGSSLYSSYFKLYDATETAGTPIVGVTDGGYDGTPTFCGVVKINSDAVSVAVFTGEIEAVGTYHIWLHSWIDADDGESAEIIVGAVGSSSYPNNPNAGLAYGSQLLGRVTVVATDDGYAISAINQDYLSGGEHLELLWGACE